MHGVPLQNNAYNRLKTTGAETHAKMMIACASKVREKPAEKGHLPPHVTIAIYLNRDYLNVISQQGLYSNVIYNKFKTYVTKFHIFYTMCRI